MEDEGNANQKLMAERSAADGKIKSLEEQMTLSEDNISKVINLVKILDQFGHTDRKINNIKTIQSIVNSKLSNEKERKKKDEKITNNILLCVASLIEALDFRGSSKITSSERPVAQIIKYLTFVDSQKNAGGIYSCIGSHGYSEKISTLNNSKSYFLTKYSMTAAAPSSITAISQTIDNCKKLYALCDRALAGSGYAAALESKIMTFKFGNYFDVSAFSLNENKPKANEFL